MRARLALDVAGQKVEHREVVLRDKPPEMIAASPKATVPVLVLPDGNVIDESLAIMTWALARHDPEQWLTPERESPATMQRLIARNDDQFKQALDRYKYPSRYPGVDPLASRDAGATFLHELNERLLASSALMGSRTSLADMAIAPFVRQFAMTDRDWFDDQPWSALRQWLDAFLGSERFGRIMTKHPRWVA